MPSGLLLTGRCLDSRSSRRPRGSSRRRGARCPPRRSRRLLGHPDRARGRSTRSCRSRERAARAPRRGREGHGLVGRGLHVAVTLKSAHGPADRHAWPTREAAGEVAHAGRARLRDEVADGLDVVLRDLGRVGAGGPARSARGPPPGWAAPPRRRPRAATKRAKAASVSGPTWCSMPSASCSATSGSIPRLRSSASTLAWRSRDAAAILRPARVNSIER